MAWRGEGYSPEYHRLYPSAEDCEGSGLISSTDTLIEIKAVFYPAIIDNLRRLPEDTKTIIGEIQDSDYIMYGTLNLENDTYYDLSGLDKNEDLVNYKTNKFKVEKVFKLPKVGQGAILSKTGGRVAPVIETGLVV